MTAHTQRAHARLAPSAAYRWIACPGSVALSEGIPDEASSYAAEGTAAHELAAHCLEKGFPPSGYLGSVIDISGLTPGERFNNRVLVDNVSRFEVTEEMVEAVEVYLDHVKGLCGPAGFELDIEQRLDMRHIHPEIYGTGDAVVYQHDTGWLHVIDFKYGKGVAVSPEANPQLMLYGAGAARRYHNRKLAGVTLHIVQPRAAGVPVKTWETDYLDLMDSEIDLGAAAKATEAPDAPFNAGDWCRFCKAAAVCPTLRERSRNLALSEFAMADPATLAPGQLAEVLREAELVGNWVKAVQEYAHKQAVAGNPPTGFKLVAKRAVRKWKSTDDAETEMLLDGLSRVDLYTEPEFKSPAQVEKTIGKKAFTAFEALVDKKSSGTNLVPEADPRPAVKADALAEFAEDVGT